MKKTFFIQGAFDIVNACHVEVFKLASGGNLIVALNTDELIRDYKKREPTFNYNERKLILEGMKYVVKVISCNDHSCIKLLKKYKPDIYLLGQEYIKSDYVEKREQIEFIENYGGKVILTKFYKKYLHSSDVRRKIKNDKSS